MASVSRLSLSTLPRPSAAPPSLHPLSLGEPREAPSQALRSQGAVAGCTPGLRGDLSKGRPPLSLRSLMCGLGVTDPPGRGGGAQRGRAGSVRTVLPSLCRKRRHIWGQDPRPTPACSASGCQCAHVEHSGAVGTVALPCNPSHSGG